MPIIVNDALLQEFRCKSRCEICSKPSRGGMDPMHIFARGRESAFRMDVFQNIVAGCRSCHLRHHSGQIKRDELIEIVAKREGCSPQEILDYLWKLRSGRE
jgi:hypothetical protein